MPAASDDRGDRITAMHTLLVIDDERGIRFAIEEIFREADIRVLSAESAEQGLNLVSRERVDVVLLDIRLGEQSGLEVFSEIRRIDPTSIVVFITGHGTADTAIEAMKLGAFDYLVKPLDFDQLQRVLESAFKVSRLVRVPTTVDAWDTSLDTSDRLVGSGPAMQLIGKQIGRIAPQDVNVLISGESGTGKELVAQVIFQHSRRSLGPFLAINCAAIPEPLLESELFGHERGAFTGADRRRIGKFEQCDRGTIFLDEVGDMPLSIQAKILRLLQERQFERLGGNDSLSADVRIIAATNQSLESLIEVGRFRKDLYYRLRGVTLHLPPLRERPDDIPELAHYFTYRINRQLGTVVQAVSTEALELLQNYSWPGNVRELQSVIREALIASAGPTLLAEFLPAVVSREPGAADIEAVDAASALSADTWESLSQFVDAAFRSGERDVYWRALRQFDAILVNQAMRYSQQRQSRAAEILGLSRPTLRQKLRLLASQLYSEEKSTSALGPVVSANRERTGS